MASLDTVYIHIPFCHNICSYCDFCKFNYEKSWVMKYLVSLEKEIAERYMDEEIKKLYIGGGTPSVLDKKELEFLFLIIKKIKLAKEYEFTFECNLEDINEELIDILLKGGVNRISVGIESFNESKLKFLERKASFSDARRKINLLKQKGLTNINIDFMYAIPGESVNILKKDLRLFVKLDVTHISTYSLIIEPNTKLSARHITEISEDLDADMYDYICKYLAKKGYKHYEISNFAKEGYESKHNLTYWNNEEYYGFGLGASGYTFDVRYTNTRSLTQYNSGKYVLTEEILSQKDKMDYEIILGLRKLEGINLKTFYEKYHINMQNKYPIEKLIENNDLIYKDGNIFINPDKLYIMNEILLKLV